MGRIIAAALGYFGAVFAFAFVLGTVRTLWLAPRVGALAAVGIEVPLVLAASALAARAAVQRRALRRAEAAAMGAAAFALLMAAEWALAQAFGQNTADWLAAMTTAPGALGLAGQVGFGVMPWIVWRGDR